MPKTLRLTSMGYGVWGEERNAGLHKILGAINTRSLPYQIPNCFKMWSGTKILVVLPPADLWVITLLCARYRKKIKPQESHTSQRTIVPRTVIFLLGRFPNLRKYFISFKLNFTDWSVLFYKEFFLKEMTQTTWTKDLVYFCSKRSCCVYLVWIFIKRSQNHLN